MSRADDASVKQLLLNPGTNSYGNLLSGSRNLIQEVGPTAFRDGFGKSMLDFLRAPFVSVLIPDLVTDLASEGGG